MSARVREPAEVCKLLSLCDGGILPPDLAERIAITGALLLGHFLLQSGKHSNLFFRTGQLLYRRDDGELFAKALMQKLEPLQATKIASTEVAPRFLAERLGEQLNLPTCSIKVDQRRKPTMNLASGSILPGDRVLIVSDFITTGSSHSAIVNTVEKHGAQVVCNAALTVLSNGWVKTNNKALLWAHWPVVPSEECEACKRGEALWPAYEFA